LRNFRKQRTALCITTHSNFEASTLDSILS